MSKLAEARKVFETRPEEKNNQKAKFPSTKQKTREGKTTSQVIGEGMTTVQVIEGKGLASKDPNGMSDPYCIIGIPSPSSPTGFSDLEPCVRSEVFFSSSFSLSLSLSSSPPFGKVYK
jgi:hypothetical protein